MEDGNPVQSDQIELVLKGKKAKKFHSKVAQIFGQHEIKLVYHNAFYTARLNEPLLLN